MSSIWSIIFHDCKSASFGCIAVLVDYGRDGGAKELRQIKTADLVGMGQMSCLYTIFQCSVVYEYRHDFLPVPSSVNQIFTKKSSRESSLLAHFCFKKNAFSFLNKQKMSVIFSLYIAFVGLNEKLS